MPQTLASRVQCLCWCKAETGNSNRSHALQTNSKQHLGTSSFNSSASLWACKRGEITIEECWGRTFVVYSSEGEDQEPSSSGIAFESSRTWILNHLHLVDSLVTTGIQWNKGYRKWHENKNRKNFTWSVSLTRIVQWSVGASSLIAC
jgi:hypothetical protein